MGGAAFEDAIVFGVYGPLDGYAQWGDGGVRDEGDGFGGDGNGPLGLYFFVE